MLKQGINFYLSLSLSIVLTAFCYLLLQVILNHFGVKPLP